MSGWIDRLARAEGRAVTDVLDDADLIKAARAGDAEAYARLYDRHWAAAMRFARSLAGPSGDVEDLVADGFARVLAALRSGNGPVEAFRPYLLSAVRNAFYDLARRSAREQPLQELRPLAPEVPFVDPVLAEDERRLVATAFGELPERWRMVLWHTEVEGETPAEVAPLLGISANAVAALAYRARQGLRERYLRAHLGSTTDERCRPTVERLAAYARQRVSGPERTKIQFHLNRCDRCRLLFGELADVNSRLGALLGPVVLGGAAAGYLAASHVAGGAAAAGAATGGGALSAVGWLAARPEALIIGSGVVAGTVAVALTLGTAPAPVEPGYAAAPPAPTAAAPPARTATPPTGAATPLALAETTPRAPGGVNLTATLDPIGSLTRGRPGLLLLTITHPTTPGAANVAVTAAFSLPDGVTLRVTNAGHGWTCASDGAVTCRRPELRAGQTTKAHIQLSVDATAADGVPSVRVSGPGVRPFTVIASHGVRSPDPSPVGPSTRPPPAFAEGESASPCPDQALACTPAVGATPAAAAADQNLAGPAPFVDPRLLGADEWEEDRLADPEAGQSHQQTVYAHPHTAHGWEPVLHSA
jgi:RNA polymerase sigma factor (sigma-70 family)